MAPTNSPKAERTWLYFSIAALLVLAAAVSAISAKDPDGVWLRVGMILMSVGAAMWLPWPALLPAILGIWLVPNYLRGSLNDEIIFKTETLYELPGLIALAIAAALARHHLKAIEEMEEADDAVLGLDEETGVYQERFLRQAIEAELLRSRRFGREFALMLVGVDELRQRFDYRDDAEWEMAFKATARVLSDTRTHIDRVYRSGERGFALLLPETGPKDIGGLVMRLNRTARRMSPAEGEPGGPLPTHFGVTFFPQCATTVDDLLKRAEVAVGLADKSPARLRVDGAEAPGLPPPESLRRDEDVDATPAPAPAVGAPAAEPESLPVAASSELLTEPQRTLSVAEPAEMFVQPPTKTETGPQAVIGPAFRAEAYLQANGHVAAPPPASAASPVSEVTPDSTGPEDGVIETEPLDDAVASLARHLDEALSLIRSMKTGAAA